MRFGRVHSLARIENVFRYNERRFKIPSRRIVDFMNYSNYRRLLVSHNTLAKGLVEIPKITAPSCAPGTNGSDPWSG